MIMIVGDNGENREEAAGGWYTRTFNAHCKPDSIYMRHRCTEVRYVINFTMRNIFHFTLK